MPKLTDERLAEMRANALHWRFAGKSYLLEPEEVIDLFDRIETLTQQLTALTALDLRCHPCTTDNHPHQAHPCVCPCRDEVPF